VDLDLLLLLLLLSSLL